MGEAASLLPRMRLLLMVCFSKPSYEGLCLVLLHLVLWYSLTFLGGLLFSNEKWKSSGSEGEEQQGLRGMGGRGCSGDIL